MKLDINYQTSLNEIQNEFSARFPNLQLRFFLLNHPDGSNPAKEELSPLLKLEEVRKVQGNGWVTLEKDQTVAKLEADFRVHFGLNAQVFRRAGKNWLETTSTDSWTLEKQNEFGAESLLTINESDKPSDYSLRDED
jgi:hypothetical protein